MSAMDEQIAEYLLRKADELSAVAPGYVSISVEADRFEGDRVKVNFRGYCAATETFSPRVQTADEIIAHFTRQFAAERPSKVKRDKAAALLAEAETLEAQGR